MREIVVDDRDWRDACGILTNDLDAPAQEIADLYKRRWLIELFFRMMKQMLRITRFLGRSENAVRIQIAVALIAFLILHLLHTDHASKAYGFLELRSNSCAPISCTSFIFTSWRRRLPKAGCQPCRSRGGWHIHPRRRACIRCA